jgi:hypothetical protein
MEVHHPHHTHKKKKWNEYALEGLMIFIAVSMGYFAENIREHHLEEEKALKSIKNFYRDVLNDSSEYEATIKRRRLQDSFFHFVNTQYEAGTLQQAMPAFYVSHHYMAFRVFPSSNTATLEQIKNTGIFNFIDDDSLEVMIQQYNQDINGLKIRQEREYGFIDRMVDPITSKYFYYKYYGDLSETTQEYKDGKVKVLAPIPAQTTLNKQQEFDWPSYITIMGQLSSIRNSSEFYYLQPYRKDCHTLLRLLRNYIGERS